MTDRPQTRGDCRHGQRPCPWVSCRYHLAELDLLPLSYYRQCSAAKLRQSWQEHEDRALALLDSGCDTCALDVADRGEHSCEEVGEALQISRAAARKSEERALRSYRRQVLLGGGGGEP